VIARLSDALVAGLADGELRKRVTTAGYEPAEKNTPAQFGAFIAADTSKWLDLVAKSNMKAN
jgi:tripartite-type tricarboxylate transporter receptor subunit TctC